MLNTALIIIDIQVGMFGPAQVPGIHKSELLLKNTGVLLAAARKAGITIVYIQHCARPGQVVIQGTEAWAIHPNIAPQDKEIVVLKKESSAFEGTELYEILQKEKINNIITCGLQSEYCVTNTSLAALELGFIVTVAKDCHSTVATNEQTPCAIVDQQNNLLKTKGAALLAVVEIVKEL